MNNHKMKHVYSNSRVDFKITLFLEKHVKVKDVISIIMLFLHDEKRHPCRSCLLTRVQIDIFTCFAPVTVTGKIDGNPFFFYARYKYWNFHLATFPFATMEDAMDFIGENGSIWREGEYDGEGDFDAGYMSFEKAKEIIYNIAEEYIYHNDMKNVCP